VTAALVARRGTVALGQGGGRWFVDETYVKVAGRWRYVCRAIDQYGQIIDVCVSARRDSRAARRLFTTVLGAHGEPSELVTDRAWTLLAVVDELVPALFHNTVQYANNRMEAHHGRLKARLRPMRVTHAFSELARTI
jgi:transposase, IS6 family